jgi:hypothetical protein
MTIFVKIFAWSSDSYLNSAVMSYYGSQYVKNKIMS